MPVGFSEMESSAWAPSSINDWLVQRRGLDPELPEALNQGIVIELVAV